MLRANVLKGGVFCLGIITHYFHKIKCFQGSPYVPVQYVQNFPLLTWYISLVYKISPRNILSCAC